MWRHNFTLAIRHFKRNKTSFLINLIGLSTGLACVFLIYLWVHDEVQMDKFHAKDDRLYQVMQNYERVNGIKTGEQTPAYLATALMEDIPEIELAVTTNNDYTFKQPGVVSYQETNRKAKPLFATADFFRVFSFKLLQGDQTKVLSDKNGIAISRQLAEALFEDTDNVIGQTINWDHDVFTGTYLITGIFEQPPQNSSLHFDILFNMELALDPYEESREWYSDAGKTFIVLKEGVQHQQLDKKFTEVLQAKPYRTKCTLFLQAFSDRYLYGQYENGQQAGGRIAYVKLFTLIALFLLIIACVNFMNLSTARASTRLKEVGVKKTTGASRQSLIFQFLSESMIMVFLSMIIAIQLIMFLLPQFNEITGKALSIPLDSTTVISLSLILICTGLIAGSYPAFYLSGFQPVKILKGKFSTSFGEQWVRKGLVVFQFALSVFFIVGFLIINQQINFIQQKHLGYNKDNIINFTSQGQSSNKVSTFMQQIKGIPGVLHATNIYGGSFLNNKEFSTAPSWEGKTPEQEIIVPRPHVGYGYIETLGIQLKEGRTFAPEFSNDTAAVILNEAAVEFIGFENPVGKILKRGTDEVTVIGVVENFHNESLHEKIKPNFIRYLPGGKDIMVKIKAGEETATIQKLQAQYEAFHPGFPFEFSFMDEEYETLYQTEKKVGILSNYAAAVAIIISCLGLFGLAMFTTERRRKEIGIRKVLGSSSFEIVKMLSSDFNKTIIVAIIVACPFSYFIIKYWLTGFAYRIDISAWFFILPAILVLFISWCTIGLQTVQAANINPVECLKDD